MFSYHLKCILYTPDTISLHTNLFDDSLGVDADHADYIKSYHHPKATRKSSLPKKPLNSNHQNTPPTPIDASKSQNLKHCLEQQIDFRLGTINIQALDAKGVEKAIALGYGVLHLYRDRLPMQEQDLPDTKIAEQESMQQDDGDGRIICILAVPSYMTNKDFMQFLDSANKDVLQYRFIKDFSPNKYMVLLKFKNRRSAFACYEKYNGRRFNMMEPEISHAVYIQSNKLETYRIPQHSFPYMKDTLAQDLEKTDRSLAELPTCPVCLERMDESTTGLLSIQCRHTVQCDCINKWGHGLCSVCRYSQRPVLTSTKQKQAQPQQQACSECFECQSTESLWICMICGHIGCGRYQDAHAYAHYVATDHLYALEIETQRVWDYLGDGYVHRLIQNMADGAIVELPPNVIDSGSSNNQNRFIPKSNSKTTKDMFPRQVDSSQLEKLENISTDYTFMLISQLDSQRIYYEDQLDALSKQVSDIENEIQAVTRRLNFTKEDQMRLKDNKLKTDQLLVEKKKEKDKLDKKIVSTREKYNKVEKNLNDEKALTKSLLKNNMTLKKEAEEKEKILEKLSLQVKDLMQILEKQ